MHLKEAITGGSNIVKLKLVRALRRFADLCAAEALPTNLSQFVTAANLIPLKKKSGQGMSGRSYVAKFCGG